MTRPMTGCCGTCAWLAKSLMPGGTGPRPTHAVYDETEPEFREHPAIGFLFVPVGYDSFKQGWLVCFRRAADLPKETDEASKRLGLSGDAATAEVLWSDRRCARWSLYEPGVGPREHLAEARAQQFDTTLSGIASNLARGGIIVAIIFGVLQLLLITPDSLGWKLAKIITGWFTGK